MSRTTVAINSINEQLDKISGLTEYVSPLVEGMNKQVKETVDLILAFERVNEKNDMLEAVIYSMAEFISNHDVDEEICKKMPYKPDEFGECEGECITCIIEYFKNKVKEEQ